MPRVAAGIAEIPFGEFSSWFSVFWLFVSFLLESASYLSINSISLIAALILSTFEGCFFSLVNKLASADFLKCFGKFELVGCSNSDSILALIILSLFEFLFRSAF